MSMALWCVLVAALLPYLTVSVAKSAPGADNHDPRGFAATLEGRAKRAYAAHLNHFETFPFFAAAVLVSEVKATGGTAVNALAAIFILARLAYTWCYLEDKASARSGLWFVGAICALAIFTSPLWK